VVIDSKDFVNVWVSMRAKTTNTTLRVVMHEPMLDMHTDTVVLTGVVWRSCGTCSLDAPADATAMEIVGRGMGPQALERNVGYCERQGRDKVLRSQSMRMLSKALLFSHTLTRTRALTRPNYNS
jgi:hypothetical protein